MIKRVTATEARKNWFRLLDDVVGGDEVVIERHGWRIVLRRAEPVGAGESPDYRSLIRASHVERADQWGWEWSGPESQLEPADEGEEPDR